MDITLLFPVPLVYIGLPLQYVIKNYNLSVMDSNMSHKCHVVFHFPKIKYVYLNKICIDIN